MNYKMRCVKQWMCGHVVCCKCCDLKKCLNRAITSQVLGRAMEETEVGPLNVLQHRTQVLQI